MATNTIASRPLNVVPDNVGGVLLGDQYQHPTLARFADDPYVSGLRNAFDGYRTSLAKVKKAIATNDPTRTEHAQFIENHNRASHRLLECGGEGDVAAKNARAELARIDAEIVQRLDIREGTYSAEIRAHFKSLASNKRLSEAFAAVDAGDAVTLAAILAAPARLSGFSDADHALIRSRYAKLHAADLLDRKEAITLALATNDRANMDAIAANRTLFPPATVAEIKARIKDAQDTRDGI